MSTTAVVVEILIIGIQACVWLAFTVLSFWGYDWIPQTISELEKWTGLVTVFALAVSYTLGVIVDRIADWSFQIVTPQKVFLKVERIRRKALEDNLRMSVLCRYEEVPTFLEYIRSRLRIVRATVLNLVLITASSSIFILVQCSSLGHSRQWTLAGFIIGTGAALIAIAFVAFAGLQIAYDATLAQVYRELRKHELHSSE